MIFFPTNNAPSFLVTGRKFKYSTTRWQKGTINSCTERALCLSYNRPGFHIMSPNVGTFWQGDYYCTVCVHFCLAVSHDSWQTQDIYLSKRVQFRLWLHIMLQLVYQFPKIRGNISHDLLLKYCENKMLTYRMHIAHLFPHSPYQMSPFLPLSLDGHNEANKSRWPAGQCPWSPREENTLVLWQGLWLAICLISFIADREGFI